mmetsp:Transcript_39418/g.92722  ORF Transcript_39418/g.92722 Transcript_39418/m.92722 type:complete len:1006 (-) Transcript_39418:8-3025(-)
MAEISHQAKPTDAFGRPVPPTLTGTSSLSHVNSGASPTPTPLAVNGITSARSGASQSTPFSPGVTPKSPGLVGRPRSPGGPMSPGAAIAGIARAGVPSTSLPANALAIQTSPTGSSQQTFGNSNALRQQYSLDIGSPTTPGLAMLQVQQPWRRRSGLSVITSTDGEALDENAFLAARRTPGGTEIKPEPTGPNGLDSISLGSGDNPDRKRDKVMRGLSRLVLREDDVARRFYEVGLALLLVYTGTVFPYRLCFHEFRIPEAAPRSAVWGELEYCVDLLFWGDLVANFFISYRSSDGTEVATLRSIAKNYFKGYFWLNLIACMPPSAAQYLLEGIMSASNDNLDAAARVARLQRISRLARLARLLRLVKVVPLLARTAALRRLRSSKPSRFLNFVSYLIWSVHLLACGWYLVAYFHAEYDNGTVAYGGCWVARRTLPGDTDLLDEPPWIHWGHSMYFVLTVFTTVGFGDISALTLGEIIYACFTMLCGTILNSIIMSEMINIITFVDQAAADVKRRKQLVTTFAEHAELEEKAVLRITKLLDTNRVVKPHFDRAEIQNLLMGGLLPQALVAELPAKVYQGRLAVNRFVTVLSAHTVQLPTRFSLLLALSLTQQQFLEGEFAYRCHEHPLNVYLVMDGTFAAVARCTREGGVPEPPPSVLSAVAEFAKLTGTRKLMFNSRVSSAKTPQTKTSSSRPRSLLHRITGWSQYTKSSVSSPLSDNGEAVHDSSLAHVDYTGMKLFPYKLFCSGNYFGDVELLAPAPRRYSVRCESWRSNTLVLHKGDFLSILEDYPQFGAVWRKVAPRQEAMRLHLMRRLTTPMSYTHLAASMIQHRVREIQGTAGNQWTAGGRLSSNPRWTWIENRRSLRSVSDALRYKSAPSLYGPGDQGSDADNPSRSKSAPERSAYSTENGDSSDHADKADGEGCSTARSSLKLGGTTASPDDARFKDSAEEKLVTELRLDLRAVRSGQRALQEEVEAICQRLFAVQRAVTPLLMSAVPAAPLAKSS